MSATPVAGYYYPNKMGRIILLAMEEILGDNGIRAVLNQAGLTQLIHHHPANNFDLEFGFDLLGNIQQSLEAMYGQRSGRGLALRSGRACFKYGLREFGPLLGLSDMAFRMLPLQEKISAGANIFAETFNRFTDQRVRIGEDDTSLHWIIDRCPVCWGRQAKDPVCHLAVGILEESLYWVSGGKHFHVEETLCMARGDPTCTIEISKQPFE